MKETIKNYYQQTQTPWGKLFYQSLFQQLKIDSPAKILDFGSGFGISATYYGVDNDLIAIEPSVEMLNLGNAIEHQLVGGDELLQQFPKASFDWIICHNVLEYVDDQEAVFSALLRLLKPAGRLSLIKHHQPGAIIQQAVLMDKPSEALALFSDNQEVKKSYLGVIHFYDEAQIDRWCQSNNAEVVERFGIRSLYGLSQNTAIKETGEWFQQMLDLELAVSQKEPYREMAFYHHLIIEKDV